MKQSELIELYEELRRQNQEDRRNAFSLSGVAHFNHNSILRFRQIVERRIEEKQEETMAEVKKIIQKLQEIANDSTKIAEFGRIIVEDNPKLADTLQFIISVELQEKTRRENAD